MKMVEKENDIAAAPNGPIAGNVAANTDSTAHMPTKDFANNKNGDLMGMACLKAK